MEITINEAMETLINNGITPDEYKNYFEGVKANDYVTNLVNFIKGVHDES